MQGASNQRPDLLNTSVLNVVTSEVTQ